MVDTTVDGLQMKLITTSKLCAATDCKYTAVGLEQGWTSHSTQFRSFWRRCFTDLMTQPTVTKHWRRVV